MHHNNNLPAKTDADRPDGVPKRWKREYEQVLRLDVLGSSQRDIGKALDYSRTHVQRIQGMPEYRRLKRSVLEGEQGNLIERTHAALATMLPTATDIYQGVMMDKDAHNRDKLNAADSVMDRFIPKVTRAQIEANVQGVVITLSGSSTEDFLKPPIYETSYQLICGKCKERYAPDAEHTCEKPKQPRQPS